MQALNQDNGSFVDLAERAQPYEKVVIRVLHVDDDLSLLEVSKQILLMENTFEIEIATSVDEALEKIGRQHFDAVVSDYEMPQKDGLEFLKELREQGKEIPFILFTGKGREEVVVKALNLGADRYVNKHGSPETVYFELADAINKAVERKKSKQLLVQSEMKYRTLVEKSLQGILITQTSPLRLVFANEAMGTILGYSIEELKSLSPQDVAGLIHDEDKAVFFSRLEKRIHSEPANSSLEFRAVRKDGSIVWLEVFANHIEYMDKSAVQGMFLDITERKQAQATLSESEERYRDLANSLPDIVFETDANGRIIFANDRAFEIAGYTREDIEKGLNILQFIIPEERETATRNIQKFFAQGSHLPTEYTFMRKDKTTFPTLVTVNPHICGNNIIRLRGLAIDITERKKAEDALRISEKNFKAYLESSPVSVFVTNQEGKYEYINEAAIKLLGFSRDELLNMTVQQVVPEEDIPRRRFNQLKEKGYFAEEMKLEQKNSKSIDVFLSASKLPDGKLVAFCEDISERKKAEEALKQLNEVLERVGECVGAGLAVIGKDYRVVWANKLLRDLGVTSNKKCYETFNNLESVCPDCGVRKIFEQNSPIDIHEFRTVNSKGQTTWVELRVTPLKDKNGATMAALELAVPITERKKVEQELKENHDRIESMNEKLRVVGSLTRHDVGNKLMAAKSNLYLLKKRIGGNSEVAMYFDGIETAFASAERIFEFSSLYEKIGSERPSKENIFECFNQAVALLPNLGTIKIVNECQGLEVVADSLLRQIFYNFIDNSLKHGEKVNQIKISCSKEGGQVKLYYEDDGVGVSEANKIRLFEVGFTTGKGTGLGLYLVKKMMDVYGWQIQENGEPGKGIKLVMSIPEYSTNGMNNYFFRN